MTQPLEVVIICTKYILLVNPRMHPEVNEWIQKSNKNTDACPYIIMSICQVVLLYFCTPIRYSGSQYDIYNESNLLLHVPIILCTVPYTKLLWLLSQTSTSSKYINICGLDVK